MITFTKTYKFRIKEFLILALEVIIGFAATAFLLLPSVLGLMGNPRLSELPNGWNSIVQEYPQRYILALIAFFFPADMPAFPVFTPDSNCNWASVAGWLPFVGMTGVIAYLQINKRDWIKKLITLLILFAFVPVLNSMFQLMNSSIYYARWFYMLVLMFALASVRAMEDKEADWNRAVAWSTGITVGIALIIGLMPTTTENSDGEEIFTIGAQAITERFWIYVLLALASLLAFVLVYKKYSFSTAKFARMSIVGMLIVAIITSIFSVATGVLSGSTTEPIKKDILNKRSGIEKIEDIDNVRSDFYECVDNTQMFWKIQSINCFQSSVSTSIMQFYNKMGITRDVASRPDVENYALRSFFSCKYLFDYDYDDKDGSETSFISEDGQTKMPCWSFVGKYNNFNVYENDNYIPMGFMYDSFVTEEEFERVEEWDRTEAILYSMVLSREQMEKYSKITGYDKKAYSVLYGKKPKKFESIVDDYTYGEKIYTETCKKRKITSCSLFEYTKKGFKAEYQNDGEENLIFFSVPYSEGFSATVNGKAVDVEKVNYGFMAVKIPAESFCDIEFTYQTPGLSTGIKISLIAFLAFVIYMTVIIIFRLKTRVNTK